MPTPPPPPAYVLGTLVPCWWKWIFRKPKNAMRVHKVHVWSGGWQEPWQGCSWVLPCSSILLILSIYMLNKCNITTSWCPFILLSPKNMELQSSNRPPLAEFLAAPKARLLVSAAPGAGGVQKAGPRSNRVQGLSSKALSTCRKSIETIVCFKHNVGVAPN